MKIFSGELWLMSIHTIYPIPFSFLFFLSVTAMHHGACVSVVPLSSHLLLRAFFHGYGCKAWEKAADVAILL